MGNGMADLLLRGRNGKSGDGCEDKTLWEEGFLLLVYHMAQSLQTFFCLLGLTIWLLPTFSSSQKVSGREAQALLPLRKPLSLPHPKPGIAIGDLTLLICDQSKGALA